MEQNFFVKDDEEMQSIQDLENFGGINFKTFKAEEQLTEDQQETEDDHGVKRENPSFLNFQSNMKRSPTYIELSCKLCGRCDHQGLDCPGNIHEFVWPYAAKEVKLAGEFKKWQKQYQLQKILNKNKFIISLCLKPGKYQFKFIVDGVWQHDPKQAKVPDNNGGYNNVTEIVSKQLDSDAQEDFSEDDVQFENSFTTHDTDETNNKYTVIIKLPFCHEHFIKQNSTALVYGSWNNWYQPHPLNKVQHSLNDSIIYCIQLKLQEDNHWLFDPYKKRVISDTGSINNLMKITKKEYQPIDKFLDPTKPCVWTKNKSCKLHSIQGNSINFIGNKCYVFGGQEKMKFNNKMYTIDWKEETMIQHECKGIPPKERGHHIAIVDGVKLIILGGFNEQTVFNDFYIFDHIKSTWFAQKYINTDKNDIPFPREQCTVVKINQDKLILFGGYFCSRDLEYEENYNDVYCLDLIQMSWKKLITIGQIPSPRSGHSAVSLQKNHTMYIFGGFYARSGGIQETFDGLYSIKFTISNKPKWKKLNPEGQGPSPRHGHSASLNGNQYMIVFGGKQGQFQYNNDLFMYHFKKNLWIKVQTSGSCPQGRYHHNHVMFQGKLFFLGGRKKSRFSKSSKLFILSNKVIEEEEDDIFNDQQERRGSLNKFNRFAEILYPEIDNDPQVVKNLFIDD